MRRTIPHAQFLAELQAQGVPQQHYAVRCPCCGTVQSLTSLLRAGVSQERAEQSLGYACVGRFTGAGIFDPRNGRTRGDGKGCNWVLGGIFKIHELEVVTDDGRAQPMFEVATTDEAQNLLRSWGIGAQLADRIRHAKPGQPVRL